MTTENDNALNAQDQATAGFEPVAVDTPPADDATPAGEGETVDPNANSEEGASATPVPVPPPAPPREVVVKSAPDLSGIGDNLAAEDFAAAVDMTVVEFKEGDLVEGEVVRVDPDEVLVDIGYKSEGVIPAKELSIRHDVDPNEEVKKGERIEALILQMEDSDGRLILSKKRAQYERAWGKIEQVMHEGGTVTGRVIEVVKGGLIVDIGLRGFLPASLVDLRRVRDLQPFVGEDLEAKVIELDKNRNNVVLSRRSFLEEEQADQRQAFLDDLKEGEIRSGVVSSVVNFGVFVDLGGMDGLVHVSELSWEHVSHPSEIVNVGDEVQVKILEVDLDRERISLSVRQTSEDPWGSFADKHTLGAVVDGRVTKTVPFGAFVSVADGVEGLVHVSEIASHHVESPELELSVGQETKVKITEIDVERRRISLSIKQASPDWQERPVREDKTPQRHEFEREDEEEGDEPSFNADSSLEAILQELKEKGIGKK
ncbi:MAG: 30S ribosomal protein S1 [Acidimicrobiia bacterium]|nr:30S ribosomal protein S1 [Acidimicrobiia bacterium]MDH3471424.1 30S ribosomal protein S1 [Acidimicrobiia bacterium]